MGLANITNNILTDSGILVTNLTPTSRTLTINGVTYDLSADRSWTIATGVGGSGTTNYLPKFTGASTIGNSQIIDSTNVLINRTTSFGTGTYTGQKLQVTGGIGINSDSADGVARLTLLGNSSTGDGTIDWGGNGNFNLVFSNNGNTRMTLNSSGNLGLGVTPSAWSGTNVKAFQFGNSGALANSGTFGTIVFNNSYYDGGYKYITSNSASAYVQDGSTHLWYQASSGTAGNAISFTQAMTLDASGRLLVGTTSALAISSGGILQVNSPWGMSITNGGQALRLIRSGTNTWEFGQGVFTSQTGFGLTDVDAAKTVLFIQQTSGNVGIGTTSPDRALTVNGQIGVNNDFVSTKGGTTFRIGYEAYTSTGGVNMFTESAIPLVLGTNSTERMRITSGGNLLVGTTSDNNSRVQVQGQVRTTGGYIFDNQTGSGSFTWYGFGGNIYAFSSAVGNIVNINGSTGAYTAISDINKKKDFELSTLGLDAVMGLKPTLYRMKSEYGTEKHLGFIAQEVKDYIPQAYVKNGEFIGLNEMPLIAALTLAVQELKAELDSIKNK